MELAITSIVLIIVGVGIGVLSGLLGIGGGTIMVPALRLGYGLDAFMATATSLFAIIPISLAGAITHVRARTCIPKLGVVLGVAGAVTSSAGVYLGSISPAWLIMLVAAIIIVYSAFTMLRKALRVGTKGTDPVVIPGDTLGTDPNAPGDTLGTDPVVTPGDTLGTDPNAPFALTRKSAVLSVAIGLFAGLASGYVGVGGGFIMVPLMTAWLGISMKRASGTSLIAIIILAIPGVVQQAFLGHIDYLAGAMLCIGAIPGAVLGARLVPHVPERTLRFIFAGLLAVAAAMLVVNEFGLLG